MSMIMNLQNVDSFTTSYALEIILKHFFFQTNLESSYVLRQFDHTYRYYVLKI